MKYIININIANSSKKTVAYDYDYTIVNIFLASRTEKLQSFKFHFTVEK